MSIQVLLGEKMKSFYEDYTDFPYLEEDKKFQFFSIYNILRPFNLNYEQIIDGITDESHDFGIDGIYIFSSGNLIDGEDDHILITADSKINIKLIQVTSERGFGENRLLRVKNGVEKIFDFDAALSGNNIFKERAKLTRSTLKKWASICKINPTIEVIYVSNGDSKNIHPDTNVIRDKIIDYLSSQGMTNSKVTYIGTKELFNLISDDEYSGELTFNEVIEYVDKKNNPNLVGWIGTVKGVDFLKLIQDEYGSIDERYFDYNVRDYYGIRKLVNENIMETLDSDKKKNFWCMNNGITIICKDAKRLGKDLIISNFQIVNGGQTSHVLHECKDIIENDDSCQLVIKVVKTDDDALKLDIIEATNSQTAVQTTALHANDFVQKAIEEHLHNYDQYPLYYERRLNYYRRRGTPSNHIVPVLRLSQIMYSVFYKRPSLSRNNPTRAFDEHYNEVFKEDYNFDSYLFSYLTYLKLYPINRNAMKDETLPNIEIEMKKYGLFHITRIVFALIIETDSKINLRSKKSILKEKHEQILKTIFDEKKMVELYDKACNILLDAINKYHITDSEITMTNLLKKDEFDSQYLTPQVIEEIKTALVV